MGLKIIEGRIDMKKLYSLIMFLVLSLAIAGCASFAPRLGIRPAPANYYAYEDAPYENERATINPFAESASLDFSADQIYIGDFDGSIVEYELLRLINHERILAGVSPLDMYDTLHLAARIRAPEVIASFSHTRPNGTPYHTAMDETGFEYKGRWHGENVSRMHFSPRMFNSFEAAQVIFDSLADSPGHHQNMINPNFEKAGIGVYVLLDEETVSLWSAQIFAG